MLNAPSGGAAGNGGKTCAAHVSSNTDQRLTDKRTAQWYWGPEELIVVKEGEGPFWYDKRKSRLTQPERKHKRNKNTHFAPRCPARSHTGQGGGGGDRPSAAQSAGRGAGQF